MQPEHLHAHPRVRAVAELVSRDYLCAAAPRAARPTARRSCSSHRAPDRAPPTHHLHRRAGLGYLLAPLPIALYNMSSGDSLLSESNKSGQHWAEFFSTFLISLVVGTPFVMMHTGLIASGAVFMTLSGFVLAVATVALLAFFSRAEAQDDGGMFG